MGLIIYFLRHGQTALSRQDVFCGSGLDPELTPEGMEMAHAFAKAYRQAEWHAVYSSGLRRSITTAQPLCDALEINLQVRAELNEIAYGRWEGLTKEHIKCRVTSADPQLSETGLACANRRRTGRGNNTRASQYVASCCSALHITPRYL